VRGKGELDRGWRLACAAFPAENASGGLAVEIPDNGENEFVSVHTFSLNGGGNAPESRPHDTAGYGIAVDIGTTTLGLALVDLAGGNIAANLAEANRQRAYGGDVISRIQAANNGSLAILSRCIRGQIAAGIAALCGRAAGRAGIAPREVKKIAVAGNTVMLHLLLGLSCRTLGTAPFTPVTLDLLEKNSRELFGEAAPPGLDCNVAILPGIASFVGADITAGIFYTGLCGKDETSVLMDIGTNGEMVLFHRGTIYCTTAAAGPAFEGGNILWGTGSVPGAIARAVYKNGAFTLTTIGDKAGLKNGLILPSGKFAGQVPPGGIFLAAAPGGRDIVFCQKDVRELQLAKSAMRTGLDFMLEQAGLTYAHIAKLYIAGGFGFNLNLKSAAGIGLIPPELLPKVTLAGNSALGGAARYLREKGGGETMRRIAGQAVEVHLPGDARFNERFVENLAF